MKKATRSTSKRKMLRHKSSPVHSRWTSTRSQNKCKKKAQFLKESSKKRKETMVSLTKKMSNKKDHLKNKWKTRTTMAKIETVKI